ncbi:hemK methyltransferase family member 2 [Trichogramma pretiosum]|uniref:hemK methyltransferase family member 2 n=1 Tax=Trichogramma pretiosum TaxID=7493 RepID=UPI0006C96AB1|nr:hemK methyltransferase family member 2 [Trichogramma pretiosum]
METPIVKLTDIELDNVYEPSEDSFLLIDALETDLNDQLKNKKPSMCLEIGIGSGVVLSALAMALEKFCSSYFVGIDINPIACRATKKTSMLNKVDVDVVQMDLLNNLHSRNVFDIIIFNPPYVVTEPIEVQDEKLISKTWAGGIMGRQVMDKVFPFITQFLSSEGLFYLLVIKENEPESIIELFKTWSMKGSIIAERKIRGEHLYVLRFQRE